MASGVAIRALARAKAIALLIQIAGTDMAAYYWVNLSDFMTMSKEQSTALEDSLSARGMQLAVSIDNTAATYSELDAEWGKDLHEEAEAQGVPVKDGRAGSQDDVVDLLTGRRQSQGGL